jgi:hypothetical protein
MNSVFALLLVALSAAWADPPAPHSVTRDPLDRFMISERVEGVTLDTWLREASSLAREQFVEEWQKWQAFSARLSAAGLAIDDPKPENFIYDLKRKNWFIFDPGSLSAGKQNLLQHPEFRFHKRLMSVLTEACVRESLMP